jgi:hypothetical protein
MGESSLGRHKNNANQKGAKIRAVTVSKSADDGTGTDSAFTVTVRYYCYRRPEGIDK